MVDHALTTTRGVRQRLDFDREVDDQIILDCIDVAEQAPTGGNNGSRRWMIIRDQATKDRMAELYLSAGVDWVIETAKRLEGSGHHNQQLMQGPAGWERTSPGLRRWSSPPSSVATTEVGDPVCSTRSSSRPGVSWSLYGRGDWARCGPPCT